MGAITKSVGRGGANRTDDVKLIQQWLNLAIEGINLAEDGKITSDTIAAIDYFQNNTVGVKKPDGRIDPKGATFILLEKAAAAPVCSMDSITLPAIGLAEKLKAGDFATAAKRLGCEEAAVRAVTEVEARGDGFFASKRPKILFEAHIFSRLTYHIYDKIYPDISSKTWDKKLYKGGEDEYPRLEKAMAIDRDAALQSASWGMFQIMGFNYGACGYDSVEDFVDDMFVSEATHLDAFLEFVGSQKLTSALKDKKWATFAAGYNGSQYAENAYDTKMATAYKKFAGEK